MKAMTISMSGMDVEWKRLEVIAENLAHMNIALDAGNPFIAKQVVTGPRENFLSALQSRSTDDPQGVEIKAVRAASTDPVRWAYEPDNPLSDVRGNVAYTRIDHAGEMTAMVKAGRIYEANLAAFNIAKQMYSSALDLGKSRS